MVTSIAVNNECISKDWVYVFVVVYGVWLFCVCFWSVYVCPVWFLEATCSHYPHSLSLCLPVYHTHRHLIHLLLWPQQCTCNLSFPPLWILYTHKYNQSVCVCVCGLFGLIIFYQLLQSINLFSLSLCLALIVRRRREAWGVLVVDLIRSCSYGL